MEKTGVKVKAWLRDGTFLGKIDISKLKPGMLVREIGPLVKVTGEIFEDDIDYLIPVEGTDGEEYNGSPLLFE